MRLKYRSTMRGRNLWIKSKAAMESAVREEKEGTEDRETLPAETETKEKKVVALAVVVEVRMIAKKKLKLPQVILKKAISQLVRGEDAIETGEALPVAVQLPAKKSSKSLHLLAESNIRTDSTTVVVKLRATRARKEKAVPDTAANEEATMIVVAVVDVKTAAIVAMVVDEVTANLVKDRIARAKILTKKIHAVTKKVEIALTNVWAEEVVDLVTVVMEMTRKSLNVNDVMTTTEVVAELDAVVVEVVVEMAQEVKEEVKDKAAVVTRVAMRLLPQSELMIMRPARMLIGDSIFDKKGG